MDRRSFLYSTLGAALATALHAAASGRRPRIVLRSAWLTINIGVRAYVDGALDELKLDPVARKRTDRYFTHEGPGGGDRGRNPYFLGRGIFRYDSVKHATTKPGGGSDFTVGARDAVGKNARRRNDRSL